MVYLATGANNSSYSFRFPSVGFLRAPHCRKIVHFAESHIFVKDDIMINHDLPLIGYIDSIALSIFTIAHEDSFLSRCTQFIPFLFRHMKIYRASKNSKMRNIKFLTSELFFRSLGTQCLMRASSSVCSFSP